MNLSESEYRKVMDASDTLCLCCPHTLNPYACQECNVTEIRNICKAAKPDKEGE